MSNEAIDALVAQVRDTAKPVEERRAALRHICALRNESASAVAAIPAEDLSAVVSAMTVFSTFGSKDLSLMDAVESIRNGKAKREFQGRRV